MKKLPLAFAGCLLGLAGAGNLILDTLPELSHVFSLLGLGLWIIFLISHLLDWQEAEREFRKPPVLSGMATFPMAGMILSTYVLRLLPSIPYLAHFLWWFSFLLDVGLFTYFSVQLLTSKEKPLPTALLGQEGIYCAPFSLLLASLVRVWGQQLPTWGLMIMIIASQAFFLFVLSRLPYILKHGFQPAFSALTFPTIVTATSLKMAQGIIQNSLLSVFVRIETLISLTILIFVLFSYLIWMKKSSS